MAEKKRKNKPIEDNNVYYRSSSGRYFPFGLRVENYLPDGVYYVRHKPSCTSTTNVQYLAELFHMNRPNKPIEIDKVCALEDAVEYVQDHEEYRNLINKGSYCLQDIIHIITKLLFEKYGNLNDN